MTSDNGMIAGGPTNGGPTTCTTSTSPVGDVITDGPATGGTATGAAAVGDGVSGCAKSGGITTGGAVGVDALGSGVPGGAASGVIRGAASGVIRGAASGVTGGAANVMTGGVVSGVTGVAGNGVTGGAADRVRGEEVGGSGGSTSAGEIPWRDGFPCPGVVRCVRRRRVLSQRELAEAAGVARSTVGRIEAGTLVPSLRILERLLGVAGLSLVVVDAQGRVAQPMADWDDTRNGAGNRYPSHLEVILDPEPGDWWGDVYGLMRPPETFHRDRYWRDAQRTRSQWEVRVARFRHVPPPKDPFIEQYWRGWRAGQRTTAEEWRRRAAATVSGVAAGS